MKRKFQSLFLPLLLLFVFHFLHSPPAFADTDGSEIQVISPSYLEVQLGPAFAGTEFQFRTDTGIYPGLIQVGGDGVLRLEIGGSSHYILSCVSTGMMTPGYIPQPEITSPPMSTPYVPDYQSAAQVAPVTQVESRVPSAPGTQIYPDNPVQTAQSTPLPVQSVPEEYVPEQISYEQPVEDIVYYYVPSSSMEPTLKRGSIIFGYCHFKELKTGDIIVFEHDHKLLVKRIAACGGDIVIINDKSCTVPEDSFFVLGDNADNSLDSRYWSDPFVPLKDVIARVFA